MMPRDRESVAAPRRQRCLLVALSALLFLWACLARVAPVCAQTWALQPLLLAQPRLSSVDVEARNTTMARALFDEGLRFVDSENWLEAQDRFGRVLTLRYSAVAAYNLGLAQARLGHGVVAAASLRRLLTDPNLDQKVRERASALLNDVEAHFAWLKVRVLGDCKDCSLSLNDDEWPWAVVGVAVPVDAGSYALRLHAGGRVLSEERLEIAPAAHVEATLRAGPVAAAAPRSGAAPAASAARAQALSADAARDGHEPSILASGWFWGAMGVLAIGATTAIILGTR